MRASKLDPNARYVQPPDLAFDEDAHHYVHAPTGRELRSVTRYMHENKLGFDPEGIPEPVLERVSARGRYVHAATVLVDEDDLDEERVAAEQPEYVGFIRSYQRAIAETGFQPVVSELRLYSPRWWYAGSPDKVGLRNVNGRIFRVGWELKTGDTTDVDVQAGAYDNLWNEWFPQAPIHVWECIKLEKDGRSPKPRELDVKAGLLDFQCCLRLSARREGRRNGRARA